MDVELDAKILFASLQKRTKTQQSLKILPELSHNFKFVKSLTDSGFEGVVPELVLKEILGGIPSSSKLNKAP